MKRGMFGGKAKWRLSRLEAFYEKNINSFLGIPNIGLSSLNLILGEVFDTQRLPRLNLVLLKINYSLLVRPQKRIYFVRGAKRLIYEYSIRVFGRLFTVLNSKTGGRKMIDLKLNVKTLHFSWSGYFREEKNPPSPLKDLVLCADFSAKKFKTAVGMGVKKTDGDGCFKIGGRRITLKKKQARQIVLVFFDQGKLFVFDLNGKKIQPLNSKKAKAV